MKDEYDLCIKLNRKELPDETALIENLINNNDLGRFLYTVANDILEGRYSLEEGHTRIVLKQLVETVTTIFETIGSMDGNVQEITESLNLHTELLKTLESTGRTYTAEVAISSESEKDNQLEHPTPKPFDLEMESTACDYLDIYRDGESDGGLTINDDLDDIFDLNLNE
jgi:hypothetical protein